ncbi:MULTISPECIES: protein translocase subunit SecF [unclassified Actinobaculum]|uniref:protein translocase subunit SecF n=1 Tax=unclassified Actinobaculum TaxID=2609299 RepID=UPI000D52A50B|nr:MULTISPECIES: protein translocase subunit SecF [unclassified Actinobaculum]AWE42471.1 protein translocase subunit SecF [Actinobaculum sp. 313]RTE48835.1 protein translocase subunit SecF [Actinobaculum sp. 352]
MSLASWGNDLYRGDKSFDIVGKRKIWFTIAGVAVLLSIVAVCVKGLNLGIEFTGGSQFTVSNATTTEQQLASDVLAEYTAGTDVRVVQVGDSTLRIQTSDKELTNARTEQIRTRLAEAYGVDTSDVTSTYIGPTWGQNISVKALQGFVVFILLVAVGLTLYFRSWRNAVGAILALFHDLAVTVGVYCLCGFEVTPSTVIGLLTILGYSLYDTVVVFDKVRENTAKLTVQTSYTFAESTNLAVNQTLIRSINTSVTSILPIASILFIGVFLLGAGTLRDLALVMFVGLILSTVSSIFVASPLAVTLMERSPEIRDHTERVLAARSARLEERDARVAAGEDVGDEYDDALNPTHGMIRVSGQHLGVGAQPKRKSRSKK